METRVLNAINSNAYLKIKNIEFSKFNNCVFIGTGGSLAGTKFSSKMINYLYGTNKGRERGFLSFEGAVAPASLFLKLYFENNCLDNLDSFITECMTYWKNYFDKYFKSNKKEIKEFFTTGNCFNIFRGNFTESSSIDFESKLIESGVFNCLIHEKKNFSHGRFIN